MKPATLAYRAELSRKIARSHRAMAAEAIAVAERLEAEALDMDAGIDPHDGTTIVVVRPTVTIEPQP